MSIVKAIAQYNRDAVQLEAAISAEAFFDALETDGFAAYELHGFGVIRTVIWMKNGDEYVREETRSNA